MSEVLPEITEPAPPRGALHIVLFIVFLDLMGFGIILPQLPFFAMYYHVSPLAVTLLFSIYSICQFIATPLLGLVSDRYGRRPVLIFSQLGSAMGYVLLGVVMQLDLPNVAFAMALIYLSRIIDGISGGNISTAQAYISDVTTPTNRAKGMGMMGAAFGIGFSVGPAIGGLVGNDTTRASWPAFTAALFSLTAMVLSMLWLPESRAARPVNEEVLLHPKKLVAVMRPPVLRQLLIMAFVSMTAFTMMECTIALYLQARYTFGPLHTPYGMRQVSEYFGYVGFFIVVVQGGLIGRLTKRFGDWRVAIAGALLVSIGMVVYVLTNYEPVLWLLLLGGAINATGRSLQGPTTSSLVSKMSDRAQQGAVFGVYGLLGSLGRVVGPIIAGLLYEHVALTAPFAACSIIILLMGVWLAILAAKVQRGGGALVTPTAAVVEVEAI